MAFHLYPWTWETTSTTGTGDVTLGGAVTGWRAFSASFADGDTMRYALYDGTNFEEGIGTYHSGANSVSRTTVIRSSNANAAVNWGAGQRQITCTLSGYDAEQLYTVTKNGYVKRTGDPASGTPTAWGADLAGQLIATATNDSASAGNLGEYKSTIVLAGSAVSLSNSAAKDICTLALTAGDWDVQGEAWLNLGTGVGDVACWINTSTNAAPGVPSDQIAFVQLNGLAFTSVLMIPTAVTRWSLSGNSTVFFGALVAFSGGSSSGYGRIRARRVR